MKKNKLSIIFIAISVILAVICFFVLPDRVITQFSFNNKGVNTMPKLGAIAIPFVLVLVGSLFSISSREGDKQARIKSLTISIVGLVAYALLLVINCILY